MTLHDQGPRGGVHYPTMAGIVGKGNIGSHSIVLVGGYEDNGDSFYYTGTGGRDKQGTAETDAAIARNCKAPFSFNEKTDKEVGAMGREGKSIRVVQSAEY